MIAPLQRNFNGANKALAQLCTQLCVHWCATKANGNFAAEPKRSACSADAIIGITFGARLQFPKALASKVQMMYK
jgi:hypothetical protein